MTNTPDYRAFARDLMKLCKKHGVRIYAKSHAVAVGPASARVSKDYDHDQIVADPAEVTIGRPADGGFTIKA